jgi:chaperonin GroEL
MTTKRQVLLGNEAKEKLRQGMNVLASAVEVTLGANGRNVVIQRLGMKPHVTKDGVTVAKSVNPADPIEMIGASLIREAALKTAEDAGDATTTSTILAKHMINAGLDLVLAGENPVDIKAGIEKAVIEVVSKLKSYSKPCDTQDMLFNVASISANNDRELGKVIADVVGQTGKYGIVKVENSNTTETHGAVIKGMTIDSGWASPYFVNNNKMEARYNTPYIMVCDMELSTMTPEIGKLLAEALLQDKRPLVIIAKDIYGEFLQTMVMNKHSDNVPIVCIKAPSFGDIQKAIMEDICIATGATVISEELGLPFSAVRREHFGSCGTIIVSQGKTVVMEGVGDEILINSRVEQLQNLLSESINDRQKDMYKKRIANMRDGIGIIYVGATTETELMEKKDRVDDAVCATKAAQEEGVIAGGGTTLLRIANELRGKSDSTGQQIVYKALEAPFEQILKNSGFGSDKESSLWDALLWLFGFSTIDQEIDSYKNAVYHERYGYGVDAKNGEVVNMFEAGIIDPTKVARVALENAASVACLFLTTECVSYEYEKEA